MNDINELMWKEAQSNLTYKVLCAEVQSKCNDILNHLAVVALALMHRAASRTTALKADDKPDEG